MAELLIGFFHFYTNYYDPDSHVITSSHAQSFYHYSSYVLELEQQYKDCAFIRQTFVEDVRSKKWSYFLVDPFDRTYNPAKLIQSHSNLEDRVYSAMSGTLECLCDEGELLLEMEILEEMRSRRDQEKRKNKSNKRRKRYNAKQPTNAGG
jgi:hypothetical protein